MNRYFIELAYRGTAYAGFQIQQNAITVQSEVEKALATLYRQHIELTGSSRTDSGVHALQNFFHFDTEVPVSGKHIYNLNSLLPPDIVIHRLLPVEKDAHCRFDAVSRAYCYNIYRFKDPFKQEYAYYYPYELNRQLMQEAASYIIGEHDFTSFSKRNTQVKTFICRILQSEWVFEDGGCSYRVRANRFLRGMVRGLAGTMLRLGRSGGGIDEWKEIIAARDCSGADFSVPGRGLWLEEVEYPAGYFGLRPVEEK